MSDEIKSFLKNNLFLFDSYRCEHERIIKDSSIDGQQTIKIGLQKNIKAPIKFAFAANGHGLIRVGERGKLLSDDLLGNLISIKDGDSDVLLAYFKDNGFFFELDSNDIETIDTDTLFEIIKRLRATIELLSQVGELKPERKSYSKILSLAMYLMFAPQIELTSFGYKSANHSFVADLENTDHSQDLTREQEIFDKGSFAVTDSIYGSYEFDNDTYQSIMNGYSTMPGFDDLDFKKIVHYYANKPNTSEQNRKIVDFLFHYEMNVGIIRNFRSYGTPEHYQTPNSNCFSLELKHALIKVAKIVIGEELNANIGNIHPKYDVISMSPKWAVDSLMSALYFSVFYMNPELELYKQCENPSCRKYFIVRSTATNRKYCCSLCSNAVQQAKSRKRKKEQALK